MLLFLFITITNRCIEVSGRGVYKLEQCYLLKKHRNMYVNYAHLVACERLNMIDTY